VRHVMRRKNCPVTGPMSLENTLRTTPNLNLKRRGENSMALKRGRIEDGVDAGRASSARYG